MIGWRGGGGGRRMAVGCVEIGIESLKRNAIGLIGRYFTLRVQFDISLLHSMMRVMRDNHLVTVTSIQLSSFSQCINQLHYICLLDLRLSAYHDVNK